MSHWLIPSKTNFYKSMKKVFIGIDFSKLKFDAAIYLLDTKEFVSNNEFENNPEGYLAFMAWVNEKVVCKKSALLFCGEHTGYYSYNLPIALFEKGYDIWLTSGLDIKLSLGIKREKTDKLDAQAIALYSCRHVDKFIAFKPVSEAIVAIKDLLAYRNRLVEIRKILSTASGELNRVRKTDSSQFICQESKEQIKDLDKKILACEKRIKAVIKQDTVLSVNYKLITSIKGIGLVNSVLIIVATGNFTLFDDPRKFGCYAGVVPFKHKSGTSVKGKTRVSKLANKAIKTSLTLAARNSIRFDPQMREYYIRKKTEGKNDWLILNNVKNKLVHRIFAVVRTGKEYDLNYSNQLKSKAA